MAEIELNIAHRNAILDATGAVFNAGALDVRSGARPGADETATGTLLCTVTVPNPAFASASSGTMAKAGVWSGTVLATGEPGYFRLRNSGGTQIREGDAAEDPGSGETLILDGLEGGDLVEDGTLTIDVYVISQPAGDAV
jgi:hypothetical protein